MVSYGGVTSYSELNYLEFSFCQQNLENSRFCQKNRENSRICSWFCRKNLGLQNGPYFCVFASLYRFLYWFWEKNQLFCSLEESWKFKILVCWQNLESARGISAVDVTRTWYTKLEQLIRRTTEPQKVLSSLWYFVCRFVMDSFYR